MAVINIGTNLNFKGLQDLSRWIQKTMQDTKQLSNAFKSLSVAGNSGSKDGGLLAQFQKQEKAMRSMTGTTKETAKVLDTVFKRAVDAQGKTVDRINL